MASAVEELTAAGVVANRSGAVRLAWLVLVDSGVGSEADVDRAREEAGSFGLFIRRLVGLDPAAAKDAFAGFLDDKCDNANQIEFVNLAGPGRPPSSETPSM